MVKWKAFKDFQPSTEREILIKNGRVTHHCSSSDCAQSSFYFVRSGGIEVKVKCTDGHSQ